MRSMSDLLTQANLLGSFGALVSYIDSELPNSLPHISIPAALSLCSTMKSKRVHLKRPTYPSLFTCVVADSGSGKTDSHAVVTKILTAAGLTNKILQGVPGTDSGLQKSLKEKPRQLILWDELGIAITHLSESKNTHEARILAMMMELYSKTGLYCIGKQYSTLERVDIQAPFLNVLGASTPVRFFGALNENFVHDGLLPRWLVFFADSEPAERLESKKEVPEGIINYFKMLETWVPPEAPGNLLQVLERGDVELRFSPSALLAHKASKKEFLRFHKNAKTPLAKIFWTRGYENYCKVLIAVSEAEIAKEEHVYWASDLVETCILTTIRKCEEKLRPSNKDSAKEKFLTLMGIGETISLSEISRIMWRSFNKFERKDIAESLCEAGIWQAVTIKQNSQRPSTLYRRVK